MCPFFVYFKNLYIFIDTNSLKVKIYENKL